MLSSSCGGPWAAAGRGRGPRRRRQHGRQHRRPRPPWQPDDVRFSGCSPSTPRPRSGLRGRLTRPHRRCPPPAMAAMPRVPPLAADRRRRRRPARAAPEARGSDLRVHFKNTREAAHALRGKDLTKAKEYLQAVLDRKRCVPFLRYNGALRSPGGRQVGCSMRRWRRGWRCCCLCWRRAVRSSGSARQQHGSGMGQCGRMAAAAWGGTQQLEAPQQPRSAEESWRRAVALASSCGGSSGWVMAGAGGRTTAQLLAWLR